MNETLKEEREHQKTRLSGVGPQPQLTKDAEAGAQVHKFKACWATEQVQGQPD